MNRVTIGNLTGSTSIEVGEGLPTRLNCIIGLTRLSCPDDYAYEVRKIDMAARLGIDTITDLSMVRLSTPLWMYCKQQYPSIGVGINPTYLPYVEGNESIRPQDLLQEVRAFVTSGGDQLTINFFPRTIQELDEYSSGRKIPITSRQGALLAVSMRKTGQNNPYWAILEDLLAVFHEYRVTVNLGATYRPAGISEANDRAHIWELEQLLELHKRFDEAGVQSLVEGISHLPLHEIGPMISGLRQRYGRYIPFQALGPVTTDVHDEVSDHIAAAIGMAEAARYNVGKITTIPPREHSGYPAIEDTERGILTAKLAVHAGDLSRLPHLAEADAAVLTHRARFHTCNLERNAAGCNKCLSFCPLILEPSHVNKEKPKP